MGQPAGLLMCHPSSLLSLTLGCGVAGLALYTQVTVLGA